MLFERVSFRLFGLLIIFVKALLLFVVLNTVSVAIVQQILDDFVITGGVPAFVLIGVIIGLLNLFLKPLLKVLSLPFIFLTAGLFVIVVNAVILWFAEVLVRGLAIGQIALSIDGMFTYVAAVLLLGFFNYLFQKIIR